MPKRRYHIVMNTNAGTVKATGLTPEGLLARFAGTGHEVTLDADGHVPLERRIKKALSGDAEVIVAAGGDGTVTALAEAVMGSGKILAVLPLGTANLLARDLDVPLDIDAWIEALDTLEPHYIDVGEVNGRIFLHKVVIGLVPGLAAGREYLRGRHGPVAFVGYLRYFLRRLARNRRLAIEIVPDEGDPHIERAQSIAVVSNGYDEGFGRFFSRHRLDRGELNLYIIKHLNAGDVFRLVTGMLMGKWREDDALAMERVCGVVINSHKRKLKAMIDGEVESLNVPLNFAIRPKALPILAGPAAHAAESGPELVDEAGA